MDRAELIERLKKARKSSNALDLDTDIALFEPDQYHVSVRKNDAQSKLIFTRHDGKEETFWARDWSLNKDTRRRAVALLKVEPTP